MSIISSTSLSGNRVQQTALEHEKKKKIRMALEPIIQSEVSQKEKDKHCILMHICGI